MAEQVQKSKKDVYRKHHSFEWFRSNIGADPVVQKNRILNVLKALNLGSFKEEKKNVLSAVIKNLDGTEVAPVFKITVHIADEISKISDENLPKYVYHRYRYDVYPQKNQLDYFPPYLQIEPSSICNFRCVFCYQTDQSFTQKSSGLMGTMSLDLFKNIIDQIQNNVEFISLASRGEPFVCKDIDGMLEYCIGKFLGLKINTNASLLNEKHCHAILSGGVNTVVFSADEAREPYYSQLRVNGSLEKIVKNIQLFNEIKQKHYSQTKIITRISGVKYTDSQNMDAMCGLWNDMVDQVAFVNYNPWENVYNAPLSGVSAPCSDLWRRMFVWYDGKVNPCDTDYKSTLSVGSLATANISELWRSSAYEQLRQTHLQKKRENASPCQRCVVV